jgi:hypothetical protein
MRRNLANLELELLDLQRLVLHSHLGRLQLTLAGQCEGAQFSRMVGSSAVASDMS